MTVAVLYAKKRSVYHDLGVDVWDEARDARLYPGQYPVVAHPPCRAWGRLHHLAKPREDERQLAFHALEAVRICGGVLEHPYGSALWKEAGLPWIGEPPDEFGGYTIKINQVDWGHRAVKPTLLYIVGVPPHALPDVPPPGVAVTTVERMWRGEREATPARLATWLVEVARRAAPLLGSRCIYRKSTMKGLGDVC